MKFSMDVSKAQIRSGGIDVQLYLCQWEEIVLLLVPQDHWQCLRRWVEVDQIAGFLYGGKGSCQTSRR